MKRADYDSIMKNEIKNRLGSDAWGFQIATRVLEKKRGKRWFNASIFTFSTAAAAGLIFMLFIFGVKNGAAPDEYNRFVNLQIRETIDEVFGNGDKTSKSIDWNNMFVARQFLDTYREVFQRDKELKIPGNFAIEFASSSEVDSLIDEALVMR